MYSDIRNIQYLLADMASVELYRGEVRLLCRKEIGEERKRLLKAIDGAAFPQLKSLPREMTHVLDEAARKPGNF